MIEIKVCVDDQGLTYLQAGAFKSYNPQYKWDQLAREVLGHTLSDEHKLFMKLGMNHVKARNKVWGEQLGISPTAFKTLWNGKWYTANVKPHERLAKKFCRGSNGTYRMSHLRHLGSEHVQMAVKDGNEHLIPFILESDGKSLKELKEFVGKGNWKRICANTVSRNKLLARVMGTSFTLQPDRKELATRFVKLPSSILKTGGTLCGSGYMGTHDAVLETCKKLRILTKPSEVRRVQHTYSDTRRMCVQRDLPFNANWNYERIQLLHEELRVAPLRERYSTATFGSISDITVDNVQEKGYTATLLKSAREICDEGEAMHHCVAIYASDVSKGTYLVYSIRDEEGKRYSTLGIRPYARGEEEKSVVFQLNQHYKTCNGSVDSDIVTKLAGRVVNKLNSM